MKMSKGKKVKYTKVMPPINNKEDKERHAIFKVKTRFVSRKSSELIVKKRDTAWKLMLAAYREQLRRDRLMHAYFKCKHKFQMRNAFPVTAGSGSAFDSDTAHEFKA